MAENSGDAGERGMGGVASRAGGRGVAPLLSLREPLARGALRRQTPKAGVICPNWGPYGFVRVTRRPCRDQCGGRATPPPKKRILPPPSAPAQCIEQRARCQGSP